MSVRTNITAVMGWRVDILDMEKMWKEEGRDSSWIDTLDAAGIPVHTFGGYDDAHGCVIEFRNLVDEVGVGDGEMCSTLNLSDVAQPYEAVKNWSNRVRGLVPDLRNVKFDFNSFILCSRS